MKQRATIEGMFDRIAHKYDYLNDLLSAKVHWVWKSKLVKAIKVRNPRSILDGATGTGDIAQLCSKFCDDITGIDISRNMLEIAKKKHPEIKFQRQDLCSMDFKDNHFDVSTISFGIRNVEDISMALSEISRVTSHSVFILEFGTPLNSIWRKVYFGTMKLIVPLIGYIFGDKKAYQYLMDSSEAFPSDDSFLDICAPYFQHRSYTPLFGGVAYIYELKV